MSDYLIIGNGVAGTTAAETIRKHDRQGSITMVTDERLPFYSRIKLIDYLAGEADEKKLLLKEEDWHREQDIELLLNCRVTGADLGKKTVTTSSGRTLEFGKLLLATGSHSFLPPIDGVEKKGVFTLRNIADADAILNFAETRREVIMVGGGLLGLEAGNSLRKRGKQVVVVEFFPRLLPRQLDQEGAARLQKIMEDMGFVFHLGETPREVRGEGAVQGIGLEGGREIEGELVVVSTGVRPNLTLAEQLGLRCDKGVVVDDRLQTSDPAVFAAGDLIEHRGMVYGIWPAASQQGKIAGANLAGGEEIYEGTTMSNILKVAGIDLASAGNIDAEGEFDCRTMASEKVYKKLVVADNKVIGCIMLGDIKKFSVVTRAMKESHDAAEVLDSVFS
jgi:nitrite reductase (NADH) large subunit